MKYSVSREVGFPPNESYILLKLKIQVGVEAMELDIKIKVPRMTLI